MENIAQEICHQKKTITKSDLASMLGVSKGTIDNYVKKGVINVVKIGKSKQSRCYFLLSEIKELLKMH